MDIMNHEFTINIEEEHYNYQLIENNSFYGNGIKVFIQSKTGLPLNTICYSCHPDFERYDEYQSKSNVELARIVMTRISKDMETDNYMKATENGIGLLLAINESKGEQKN